jgi:simple sugar transport system substrate-binding protein
MRKEGNMPARLRRSLLLLALVGVTAFLAACGSDESASSSDGGEGGKKVKLGVLLLGNGSDDYLNLGFREAATNTVKKLGKDKVDLKFVTGVGYNQQATALTDQLFREGSDIVVDNLSLQQLFYDACAKYPDRICQEEYTLGDVPPNTSGFWWKFWQGYYLEGVAAGMLSKTGVVGYLASFKQNYENAHMNALALGCQSVNPDCKVKPVIINNWYDAQKSNQAAKTLVNSGADVLAQFVDDTTSASVAQEMSTPSKPVWGFGLHLNQQKHGGDAYVATLQTAKATEKEITLGVQAALDGKKPDKGPRVYGIGEGISIEDWGPKVPKDVQEKVEGLEKEIAGGMNPFKGPIYDTKGKLRVPEGESLENDYMYASWDWRVKGVGGR